MITFDIEVCMKAYPLKQNYPFCYHYYTFFIGTFHLIFAHFHIMEKKMKGYGFSDVLFEAELVRSGSIPGLGMMRMRQPAPALSPAQIKKKEAQAGDEKPAKR